MTNPTNTPSAEPPDVSTAAAVRLNAMMAMVEQATEVATLMRSVKEQFIKEGGYSPENAEQCALLLWRTSAEAFASTAQQKAQQLLVATANLKATMNHVECPDGICYLPPPAHSAAAYQRALGELFAAAEAGPGA